MTSRPLVGWVFAMMCLIWGSTFMVLKIGLEGTPPLLGVGLRHLLASVILFAVIRYRKSRIPLDRAAVTQYLTVGLLNFFLSYSLTYSGTQYIYSNISALLWTSIPMTTALTAHFFIPAERLTWMKSAGLLLGFGGVALIFSGYGVGDSSNLLLGMTLVMAAVLADTWPNVYIKIVPRPVDPIILMGVSTGIGGAVTLAFSLFLEGDKQMVWSAYNMGIILYLAVFGTAIAWVSFYWLLRHMEVVKLSFVGFIAPIVALFMGMVVLDEYLPVTVYAGAFLVLLGIFITDARGYLALIGVGR